jgi:hypothetical protein
MILEHLSWSQKAMQEQNILVQKKAAFAGESSKVIKIVLT